MDNFYAEWRDAALVDGWEEIPGGPWGIQDRTRGKDPRTGQLYTTGERREGDRSVYLIKDDLVVYLVDRGSLKGRETWTAGWFQNGHHSMGKVPEPYSMEAIEKLRAVCSVCNKSVDPSELKHLRFAEKVCRECDTPALRAEYEPAGWCD